MNDNDIMKALECCSDGQIGCVKDCPLYNYDGSCWDAMKHPALSLITRQKAEVNALRDEIEYLNEVIDDLYETIARCNE